MREKEEKNESNKKGKGGFERKVRKRKRKRILMIGGEMEVMDVEVGMMMKELNKDISLLRKKDDINEKEMK